MAKLNTKEISVAGVIAAVYVVVSYFLAPISFGIYQVRVAEALTVLPFLSRAAVPGLFVGCFLANIFGGNGWVDIIFGSLLTLAAALLTRCVARLSHQTTSRLVAIVPVVLMWLGSIYLLSEFDVSIRVLVGAALSLVAVAIAVKLGSIDRGENSGRTVLGISMAITLVIAIMGAALMKTTLSTYFLVVGSLLILGTLVSVFALTRLWVQGLPPNMLIAPLPPVLINAFGVAIYLAPIIGAEYWFTVQMIGVGQLVACYLLGLPLLMLLRRRGLFG